MKLNIEFDLDGVLIQYNQWFEMFMRSRFMEFEKPQKQFHHIFKGDVPDERVERLIYRAMDSVDEIHPYPDAYYTLRELHCLSDPEEPIRIVTSRPDFKATHTLASIKRVLGDIPFSVSMVSSSEKKAEYISTKCFIDDRRRTALDLARKGLTVFMPKRSYNTPIEDPNLSIWDEDDWSRSVARDHFRDRGRIIMITQISNLLDPEYNDLIFS